MEEPVRVRVNFAERSHRKFAGGDMPTAGRNGITTGRRKTFLTGEKSSAGQDEMTVIREQPLARQATELYRGPCGNFHASDVHLIRTSLPMNAERRAPSRPVSKPFSHRAEAVLGAPIALSMAPMRVQCWSSKLPIKRSTGLRPGSSKILPNMPHRRPALQRRGSQTQCASVIGGCP